MSCELGKRAKELTKLEFDDRPKLDVDSIMLGVIFNLPACVCVLRTNARNYDKQSKCLKTLKFYCLPASITQH